MSIYGVKIGQKVVFPNGYEISETVRGKRKNQIASKGIIKSKMCDTYAIVLFDYWGNLIKDTTGKPICKWLSPTELNRVGRFVIENIKFIDGYVAKLDNGEICVYDNGVLYNKFDSMFKLVGERSVQMCNCSKYIEHDIVAIYDGRYSNNIFDIRMQPLKWKIGMDNRCSCEPNYSRHLNSLSYRYM